MSFQFMRSMRSLQRRFAVIVFAFVLVFLVYLLLTNSGHLQSARSVQEQHNSFIPPDTLVDQDIPNVRDQGLILDALKRTTPPKPGPIDKDVPMGAGNKDILVEEPAQKETLVKPADPVDKVIDLEESEEVKKVSVSNIYTCHLRDRPVPIYNTTQQIIEFIAINL